MIKIDEFDQAILRQLQLDGKISVQDLATKTNMSASPCWRRVRRMETEGTIDRYVAVLNPRNLGLQALAHVHVSLMDHTEQTIATFDNFVQTQDQIVECSSITGDNDYVLKVVAEDPEALESFIMKSILRLGIVRSSMTNFVLRRTKETTALPVRLQLPDR
ncbi:Lrp/AsnC family transcriptional regulator [Candidatus Halocynthiibacter alkanivorans]|jgi:Lrp/AsnC family transcriptional regulator, leucine-responsive regulatory protein|uniref:Lrp/AsnC family transcriptional regulator n=1 Tax=Candidatus Halocynthiibacter alkanivorans TaxID=2267619 RepID=UPI000DF1D5C1|nr:Lrp/AsnC family transcriptional regulator [Candidatus Halocynthiibacter alkanivorans]